MVEYVGRSNGTTKVEERYGRTPRPLYMKDQSQGNIQKLRFQRSIYVDPGSCGRVSKIDRH